MDCPNCQKESRMEVRGNMLHCDKCPFYISLLTVDLIGQAGLPDSGECPSDEQVASAWKSASLGPPIW